MKYLFEDKTMSIKAFGSVIKLSFVKRRYPNGRIGIELVNSQTKEPFMVLTVNVPDEDLGKDEVIIKDYSENKPWIKPIWETGYFENTGNVVASGYVVMPVWKLVAVESTVNQ